MTQRNPWVFVDGNKNEILTFLTLYKTARKKSLAYIRCLSLKILYRSSIFSLPQKLVALPLVLVVAQSKFHRRETWSRFGMQNNSDLFAFVINYIIQVGGGPLLPYHPLGGRVLNYIFLSHAKKIDLAQHILIKIYLRVNIMLPTVKRELLSEGELHIKTGSMYAEKTTVLMRDLLREKASGMRVAYFNYAGDTRNPEDVYSTHNPLMRTNFSSTNSFPLHSYYYLSSILMYVDDYDVFGIDEGQFFVDLYDTVMKLVEGHNKIVYIVGLDSDANRKKFGQLLDLFPVADSYEKLYARCMSCAKQGIRKKAIHTRKIQPQPQPQQCENAPMKIEIGGKEMYESVCRKCYCSSSKNDS